MDCWNCSSAAMRCLRLSSSASIFRARDSRLSAYPSSPLQLRLTTAFVPVCSPSASAVAGMMVVARSSAVSSARGSVVVVATPLASVALCVALCVVEVIS